MNKKDKTNGMKIFPLVGGCGGGGSRGVLAISRTGTITELEKLKQAMDDAKHNCDINWTHEDPEFTTEELYEVYFSKVSAYQAGLIREAYELNKCLVDKGCKLLLAGEM